MIHHILKQIWAQRKYNVWIFVELLLVFILMQFIVAYGFVILHNRSIPGGFDETNTFVVTYGTYPPRTSRYSAEDADSVKALENLNKIVSKVQQYKNVEIAALTYGGWGTLPYSGSSYGRNIMRDSVEMGTQVKRISSGDYFRIFRITSAKDNTWQRPANIDLNQDNAILITRSVAKRLFGDAAAIGQTVKMSIDRDKDKLKEYIVADVLNDQKRFDYILPTDAVFIAASPLTVNNIMSFNICLRVLDGTPKQQFIRDFQKDMKGEMQIGNFYLKHVKSFENEKRNIEHTFGVTNDIRIRKIMAVFLSFCMALGIIGTFWFRNQTRRSEIGLRMAMGSTRRKLQKQFVLEAIIMFTATTIPALIIYYFIEVANGYHSDTQMYIVQNKLLLFAITGPITYILLGIIVGLSAWIPAHRASKTHPVDALRDE
ncbi:MAG TPA: FtsX-like permease family protein [Perlabentimonas sp.]|nr:FtsX-like permease family protein [Perlabentimonas sp.]